MHVLVALQQIKTWMAETSAAMTKKRACGQLRGADIAEEFSGFGLELLGLRRQLRSGIQDEGRGSIDLARRFAYAGDVLHYLLGALCRLLHAAGDLVGGSALLF